MFFKIADLSLNNYNTKLSETGFTVGLMQSGARIKTVYWRRYMKKFLKLLFWLILIGVVLYTVSDRYDLRSFIFVPSKASQEEREQDVINQIRLEMLKGSSRIELKFIGKVEDMEWFTKDAIDRAYAIDDPSTSGDFDYLRYKISSINAHIVGFGNRLTVTYEFEYNETVEETAIVDEKISRLFAQWKINELSDYEKIKKIHDFIIENAVYDTDTEHYSAYDNLINKRSTCQGYMSLAYKMFTEAGIPCRIITGMGNNDSHGWNIVELDGKWYNIDCTWDDPVTNDGKNISTYDFFLKSDEDFVDHVRDEEFRSKEFYSKYVMSRVSYEQDFRILP